MIFIGQCLSEVLIPCAKGTKAKTPNLSHISEGILFPNPWRCAVWHVIVCARNRSRTLILISF